MEHLARYDIILMFRAIWNPGSVRYQLVDIPVDTLKRIDKVVVEAVGNRRGRRSLGANVVRDGERIFRVHFDASDGKCSIHNLGINHCAILEEWEVRL